MKKFLERKLDTPASNKHLVPAWQQGAKAAFLLSAGFAGGLLPSNIPISAAEMFENFAFGFVATFLVWWTACTIIVGFWRVVTHN